jgi:2'-5' RNA ligase
MPEQLSLAGFGAAPALTDRLFFAILPDMDAAERIAQLARHLRSEHGLKGRPLATERFHVTLHHVGDYTGLPQGIVDTAVKAAATVEMASFEVAFDRAASFFGRTGNRPFVLRGGDGVAALAAFHDVLGTAMRKAGLGGKANPHYTPHVTLLYDDRCIAEQPVDAVSWAVHEFVLVRSLLGQTRHVPLARLPLLVDAHAFSTAAPDRF